MNAASGTAALPNPLPVFPLTGVLLLPGMRLPLHVFEPRYCNMVRDILVEGAHIGMVQPWEPRPDNRPRPGTERDQPALYQVGCAGWLEEHQQHPDGPYLIVLRGISRFKICAELPLKDGYRRVRADYQDYAGDLAALEQDYDTAPLLRMLEQNGMAEALALKAAQNISGPLLVNQLAMLLPYSPPEKQALLEAESIVQRAQGIMTLLQLGSTVDPLADPVPALSN